MRGLTEQRVMQAVARICRRGDEATGAAVGQALSVTDWTAMRWMRVLAEKGFVEHARVAQGNQPSCYRLTELGKTNLVEDRQRPPGYMGDIAGPGCDPNTK